eukprot:622218-Karenia_brevis.AAC.1
MAEDRIEHYAVCPILWKFFSAPEPIGMGIPYRLRSKEGFFATDKGLTEEEIIKIAFAVHVANRA